MHPGGPFAIVFRDGLPYRIGVSLADGAGHAVPLRTRPGRDERSILVEPSAALDWRAQYTLCARNRLVPPLRWLLSSSPACVAFTTMRRPEATGPRDAPILVVEGPDRPFARYYRAILQAEGLNEYATIPLETMKAADMERRAVVLLDSADLPPALLPAVTDWVGDGGLLVAMRPGPLLRDALALPQAAAGVMEGALMRFDQGARITAGLPVQPVQLHGPIDRIPLGTPRLGEIRRVLTSIAEAEDAPPLQAATMTDHGRGHVLSFAFDIAHSVVLTRQGNPLWIDEERDGSAPLRPSDLLYPDFVDLELATVPSADALQRLLANAIAEAAPMPLPRLWYLPDDRRAVLIMAGDDHVTERGTKDLFTRLDRLSPPDCDLDRWECLRATSYLSPGTPLAPETARDFVEKGFEIGVHVDTGCASPRSRTELRSRIRAQVERFRASYPGLPEQLTHRIHCIVWRGWADVPKAEREMDIRLDLNYYSWPPDWLDGRRVFLTGSGIPMPYADLNGDVLDIYQAPSHLVNEDGVPQRAGISAMLDRALGPEQAFGAFGTHYDYTDDYAKTLIEVAQARGVALVSAQQMLTWLDGRDGSRFSGLGWSGRTLHFTLTLAQGAEAASALLPARFGDRTLKSLHCEDRKIPLRLDVIKGLRVAFFDAAPGRCTAQYEESSTTF